MTEAKPAPIWSRACPVISATMLVLPDWAFPNSQMMGASVASQAEVRSAEPLMGAFILYRPYGPGNSTICARARRRARCVGTIAVRGQIPGVKAE